MMGISPLAAQQERMAMMLETARAQRTSSISNQMISVDQRMHEAIRQAAQKCGPGGVDTYA